MSARRDRRDRSRSGSAGSPRAPGGASGRRRSPRPLLASIAIAVGVVAVLVVAGLVAQRGGDEPAYVPVARSDASGKAWGVVGAPVHVIEFADFQCVFCARFARETEPTIAEEYIRSGRVRVTFHHFAFLGPDSVRAAEASECAADQGRFWEYHDLLFLRQRGEGSGGFPASRLKSMAREVARAHPGFDAERFGACLDAGEKRALVERETAEGRAAGISATPSFLINGRLLQGAQNLEAFRQAIDAALRDR